MDTAVLETKVCERKWLDQPVAETKKKSFQEAVAECNGVSVDIFIDELRKRVKERYRNAKGNYTGYGIRSNDHRIVSN